MICLSEQAYSQVKGRLDLKVSDLGAVSLKNIAEPVRAYALEVGLAAASGRAEIASTTPQRRRLSRVEIAAAVILVVGTVAAVNPLDWYFLSRGESEFLAGHPKEAIEAYGRARRLDLKAQVVLIASYAAAGMGTEAHTFAEELLKKNPKFSVNAFFLNQPNIENLGSNRTLKDALVSSGLPLEVRWECLARDVCP